MVKSQAMGVTPIAAATLDGNGGKADSLLYHNADSSTFCIFTPYLPIGGKRGSITTAKTVSGYRFLDYFSPPISFPFVTAVFFPFVFRIPRRDPFGAWKPGGRAWWIPARRLSGGKPLRI